MSYFCAHGTSGGKTARFIFVDLGARSQTVPSPWGPRTRSVSGRRPADRERGENRDAACGLRPRASHRKPHERACRHPSPGPASSSQQEFPMRVNIASETRLPWKFAMSSPRGLDVLSEDAGHRLHGPGDCSQAASVLIMSRDARVQRAGRAASSTCSWQWLLETCRVTGAVMEATGIYWEKVYDVLSDVGLDCSRLCMRSIVKQIKGTQDRHFRGPGIWLSAHLPVRPRQPEPGSTEDLPHDHAGF